MRKLFILAITLCTLFAVHAESIKVAAAANITFAVAELKNDFLTMEPTAEVDIITASSGKITTQITEGAPYDIFMSADMSYPQKLADTGFTTAAPVIYANGGLILFTTKDLSLKKGLAILKDKHVQKIAIADPGKAPYGLAAVTAIEKSGLKKATEKKFVIAENISQAVTWSLTAADVGFINKSALYTKELEQYNVENKYWVEVNSSLYAPIQQGIVLLKNGADKAMAKKFYDYILSDRAKKIFIKYGYTY